MVELKVTNGTVVTMNERREVVEDGAVAVEDGRIVAVGDADDIGREYDADRVVDAGGGVVLPGFISTHAHVSDILLRGRRADRTLFEWLYNVKKPAVQAMTPSEHEVAAALFCREAIGNGVTTFVENGTNGTPTGHGYPEDAIEAKLAVYDRAGLRNVYAHGFSDRESSAEMEAFTDRLMDLAPSVERFRPGTVDTDEALDTVESYIESYHTTANGRQSVWPAPTVAGGVTPDGLAGAYEIAERHDVMTTTHTAEHPLEERGHLSSVEYLRTAGYLGDRALLGHCVQITDRDRRLLTETDARVAHNPLTNLALGTGFAPVPELIESGVTVGLGTDNASASHTVNPINDVRFAVMMHKGNMMEPGAIGATKGLEMATIDAARAIGREESLGSIERGKCADMVVLDLAHTHTTPHANLAATIVYQAQGHEIETVVCDGEVIMADDTVPGIDQSYADLNGTAAETAATITDRVGISLDDAAWTEM